MATPMNTLFLKLGWKSTWRDLRAGELRLNGASASWKKMRPVSGVTCVSYAACASASDSVCTNA